MAFKRRVTAHPFSNSKCARASMEANENSIFPPSTGICLVPICNCRTHQDKQAPIDVQIDWEELLFGDNKKSPKFSKLFDNQQLNN
jgi:hypothetical protein